MKVTRQLQAAPNAQLTDLCRHTGFLRADIWRRFGALGTQGKSSNEVRKQIAAMGIYTDLPVDGTIRSETTKDVVNDIMLYKAAAKVAVKKAIFAHTDVKQERKMLFTLLKKDEWIKDNFLHRKMRKHFKHGVSKTNNQFIVRSDRFTTQVVNGKMVIDIRIAKKYGDTIRLLTTSNGKNVNLSKRNLRIVVGDTVSIHYAFEKSSGRAAGTKELGVDKGYTEAFTDSDGDFHGVGFGKELTKYSDKVAATGKARNKLYSLEQKHIEAGNTKKANHIRTHNLGTVKIDNRKKLAQTKLRTIAYKAVHAIVDKADLIVSEDLSSPIAIKKPWKKFNRRMGSWAKGVLAEALTSVTQQRSANHVLVNAAYTSQMDSETGLLKGKRVGDKFYRENGDVIQADKNAAVNVLARLYDEDIKILTPFKEVRRILLARSPAELTVNRLELQAGAYQPSADKLLCTDLVSV